MRDADALSRRLAEYPSVGVTVAPRQLLTCREAADLLRISERQVRRLIARRELPAVQLGGKRSAVRIPADELDLWLYGPGEAS